MLAQLADTQTSRGGQASLSPRIRPPEPPDRALGKYGMSILRLLELAGIPLTEMSNLQAINVFSHYGVNPSDDLNDLKQQYKELVKKNHPDIGGSPEAMRDINAAYQILSRNNGKAPDSIRRPAGSAFEDFTDPEYYKRRVKDLSGPKAMPMHVHAFDGSRFTKSISLLGSSEAFDIVAEGMLTLAGRGENAAHTKAVFVTFDSNPNVFICIYANNRKINPMTFKYSGFGSGTTNKQFVAKLNLAFQ